MGKRTYDFAVVGGDLRQVYIARKLENMGFTVCRLALCDAAEQFPCEIAAEAVSEADTVLGPIPLSADQSYLNQRGRQVKVSLEDLLAGMKKGQRFFAGCIPGAFQRAAEEKGVEVTDLMEQEEIVSFNTIATAEGAVAEAVIKSPKNLWGSRCLALGYGRCAKTLVSLLRGFSCHIQVCARSRQQQCMAAVFGEGAFSIAELKQRISEFDFIFNTIPACVMNREILSCVDADAYVFDLASAPGGIDFEAAEELGISAWKLPGLPGKYAPESSAEKIVSYIRREMTPTPIGGE